MAFNDNKACAARSTVMQELIDRIERAFAQVPYPGDLHLTDSTYGEEPADLEIEFRGKTDWRVLSADFLSQAPNGWGTALSFFSDAALHFYLPAYLIADLRDELDSASTPDGRLCFYVSPLTAPQKIARAFGGGTMGERIRAGFDRFDAPQVAVIVAYLWWKLDSCGGYDPTIEQALEDYWLPREAGAG